MDVDLLLTHIDAVHLRPGASNTSSIATSSSNSSNSSDRQNNNSSFSSGSLSSSSILRLPLQPHQHVQHLPPQSPCRASYLNSCAGHNHAPSSQHGHQQHARYRPEHITGCSLHRSASVHAHPQYHHHHHHCPQQQQERHQLLELPQLPHQYAAPLLYYMQAAPRGVRHAR